MSHPRSNPEPSTASERSGGRTLSLNELKGVLEELHRVVAELEESLRELKLPLDEPSRLAARAAIAAARGPR